MQEPSKTVQRLDTAIQVSLFLLALSAPISIAATQTAWAFALLFWIIRAFFVRPTFRKSAFDLALLAFISLTVISAIVSYEPAVSIRKLVPVSLVTIAYLVGGQAKEVRFRRRMIAVLIVSAVATVIWTLGVLAVGKNLKVTALAADSPLRAADVKENDTILKLGGQNINSPADLTDAISRYPDARGMEIVYYRNESIITSRLPVISLSPASDDPANLGILAWSRGRDARAAGFYGHYTTYAEALQLILSLAFGLMVAVPGGLLSRNRLLLGVVVALCSIALFLTITRASWAGFLLSASVIILVGASRRTVLIAAVLAIPLALVGLSYLQQKRNVGFFDTSDNSTTWRMTVWREGFEVLTSRARHLLVGVGMDSLKTHWSEWQMFDKGNLPLGHLHSTPLQIAFERGIPALIAWIVWMFVYLKLMWRPLRSGHLEWPERGLLLGAFGGAIGFIASGLVHYNWGDSEVVMVFYLLMGLSLGVTKTGPERPEQ